ncbi:unnamed protein product [Gongylonema pulchrum]|uniref:Carbonic anhydrase n=1 Tax=Gongylonema pulchrum TaxID=637853 RepID=A0A3P6RU98_9BILA|nr:unnamed protein product [Gongylonema pulchrum]
MSINKYCYLIQLSAFQCFFFHKFVISGPCHWPNADGHQQSPVNLDLGLIKHASAESLNFLNYNKGFEGEITNNGHSVQVTPHTENVWPEIHGGGLDQAYRLAQYHFHWGQHDNEGSEHTLAGLHYPAELHLVHKGVENAEKIVVVGVFLILGDDDKPLHPESIVLQKVIEPGCNHNNYSKVRFF